MAWVHRSWGCRFHQFVPWLLFLDDLREALFRRKEERKQGPQLPLRIWFARSAVYGRRLCEIVSPDDRFRTCTYWVEGTSLIDALVYAHWPDRSRATARHRWSARVNKAEESRLALTHSPHIQSASLTRPYQHP